MTGTTTTGPRWGKIIAIVVGVIVAGWLAIVILSVVAITFLGEKPEAEFRPVGEPISAPAPHDTPPRALPLD